MRPSDSKQMGPAPLAAKRLLPAHNPGLDRGESPGHGRCQLPSCSRSLWGIREGVPRGGEMVHAWVPAHACAKSTIGVCVCLSKGDTWRWLWRTARRARAG